ncbi:hypothetical protein ASZ90_015320 [hydrocarbon metagenome]|uniref:Uncharacterized protein n=1 Tax=hydrocarbon metagenome TaxID=938273 RepID=A0A0W8F296_9ZZZZ
MDTCRMFALIVLSRIPANDPWLMLHGESGQEIYASPANG